MTACTENYECLVLDNSSKSNKIEDVVYWYKAKYPIKKFKIGGKKLWKWSKKNYNKSHESEEKNEKFKVKKRTLSLLKGKINYSLGLPFSISPSILMEMQLSLPKKQVVFLLAP